MSDTRAEIAAALLSDGCLTADEASGLAGMVVSYVEAQRMAARREAVCRLLCLDAGLDPDESAGVKGMEAMLNWHRFTGPADDLLEGRTLLREAADPRATCICDPMTRCGIPCPWKDSVQAARRDALAEVRVGIEAIGEVGDYVRRATVLALLDAAEASQ